MKNIGRESCHKCHTMLDVEYRKATRRQLCPDCYQMWLGIRTQKIRDQLKADKSRRSSTVW
jgi:RNase P subunit RPR2